MLVFISERVQVPVEFLFVCSLSKLRQITSMIIRRYQQDLQDPLPNLGEDVSQEIHLQIMDIKTKVEYANGIYPFTKIN